VSSELRQAEYDMVDTCTSDEPQTVVKKHSKMHCAVAGVGDARNRDFTFDDNTKQCSLYKHKPLAVVHTLHKRLTVVEISSVVFGCQLGNCSRKLSESQHYLQASINRCSTKQGPVVLDTW